VSVNSIIYGPVPSWRLGRSLGIDLLSTTGKTCSFDCIYCQLGRTVHFTADRREFVSLDELDMELRKVKDITVDYVTFSGVGEPTLASNLGQAIEMVKSTLGVPVAVLTNSSLMPNEEIHGELARADVVVAKLDAPSEELFRIINRPFATYSLAEICQGIRHFRVECKGKLALQMMFIEANKDHAREMAGIAEQLSPDEVQINTPLRPCGAKPLSPEAINTIRHEFRGLKNVVTVYEVARPEVKPLSLKETQRRRPEGSN